jgi:oligopeptide/dipeptide ABC transporter ATP-binding protein
MENLLEVKDLHTYFYLDEGVSRPVEGVSFYVKKGEMLALVGESGCGKTVTMLSVMRLVQEPPGKILKGEIIFKGKDLLKLTEKEMRSIRGNQIGMIFQEPMTSLNPLYTIGYQIREGILAHKKLNPVLARKSVVNKVDLKKEVIKLLEYVEIASASQRYSDYPHQLSGGLRQRAMIGQALACGPDLLIADEPTTALDVTIQAQILKLFNRLKESSDMSILLITHDLGIVAEVADRVCIMYAGRIVEEACVYKIFANAAHPYTQGLLKSISSAQFLKERLPAIPGVVPNPEDKPSGCPFHPRCYNAEAVCRERLPEIIKMEEDHYVRCWKSKAG